MAYDLDLFCARLASLSVIGAYGGSLARGERGGIGRKTRWPIRLWSEGGLTRSAYSPSHVALERLLICGAPELGAMVIRS